MEIDPKKIERKVGRMDAGEVVREAKEDPVMAALERFGEAAAAGDATTAANALEEARRLTEKRIQEIASKSAASREAFLKRVKGRR